MREILLEDFYEVFSLLRKGLRNLQLFLFFFSFGYFTGCGNLNCCSHPIMKPNSRTIPERLVLKDGIVPWLAPACPTSNFSFMR